MSWSKDAAFAVLARKALNGFPAKKDVAAYKKAVAARAKAAKAKK